MQIIDCIWKKNNCMSISDRKYNVEIKINLAFKCLLLIVYKLVVEGICLPLCLCIFTISHLTRKMTASWVECSPYCYGLRDIILFPCLSLPELSLFFLSSFTYREGRCWRRYMGGLAMVTTRGTPPPWIFFQTKNTFIKH